MSKPKIKSHAAVGWFIFATFLPMSELMRSNDDTSVAARSKLLPDRKYIEIVMKKKKNNSDKFI